MFQLIDLTMRAGDEIMCHTSERHPRFDAIVDLKPHKSFNKFIKRLMIIRFKNNTFRAFD